MSVVFESVDFVVTSLLSLSSGLLQDSVVISLFSLLYVISGDESGSVARMRSPFF